MNDSEKQALISAVIHGERLVNDLSADEFDTSVKVDGAANPSILDASFSAQANGNVLLNISLNTAETAATLNASSAYANTSATALMTDKDVNVAIENALCWAVIS